MAAYTLDAHPAEVRGGGFMVSYSLAGLSLAGRDATIEARNADELVAAKHAHGLAVLAANSHRPQHPDVTAEPRTLDAVAVSARPVTRHANGCKAVAYSTLVERPA